MKRVLITCKVMDGSICVSGVSYSMKKGQTIELEMDEFELKRISRNNYFCVKQKNDKPVPVSSVSALAQGKNKAQGKVAQGTKGNNTPAVPQLDDGSNEAKGDEPKATVAENEPRTLAELAKTKIVKKVKTAKSAGDSTKKATGKGRKKNSSKKSGK